MTEQIPTLVCIPLLSSARQEKDGLWSEFKAAFIGLVSLRNGFRLRFKASAALIEKTGRLISLERACCQFLHIRLDVPPLVTGGQDIMDISLTGGKGAKTFLRHALASIGLSTASADKNKWLTLGVSGLLFGIACCALPPLFLALGMAGLAHWFGMLDLMAVVIIALAVAALAYGLYKRHKQNPDCGTGC